MYSVTLPARIFYDTPWILSTVLLAKSVYPCLYVTVQRLTGLKKSDGVNWETAKAIDFLYPNILDTLLNADKHPSFAVKALPASDTVLPEYGMLLSV